MNARTQALPGEYLEIGSNRWTEPFWAAAKERRLVGCRCGSCATFRMPPSPFCPECLSQDIDWVELSGKATVYSFTICTSTPFKGYESLLFAPVVADLPDAPGVRLVGTLVDVDPADIHIGMPLTVDWHSVRHDDVVPIFRAATS